LLDDVCLCPPEAGTAGFAAFHVVIGENFDVVPPGFTVEVRLRRSLGENGKSEHGNCESKFRNHATHGVGPFGFLNRKLFCACELYEFATHVEPVFARFGGSKDLKRSGALEFGVALRSNMEEVVGTEIEKDKLVAFEEAETISAGLYSLAADLQRDFREQIGLIFLTDAGRVAGIINHPGEHEGAVGKMYAAGVSHLHGSGLAAEENGFGEDLGSDVTRFEDDVFAADRWRLRIGHAQEEREANDCHCREAEKAAEHGVSFELKLKMLDQVSLCAQGCELRRFFYEIAFFDPVGSETRWKN